MWYNAYFQIVYALYVLNLYFDMTHFDLWCNNILVKKVQPGGYWKYIINGDNYYVKNKGYMFYLIDFGHAYIPKKLESSFVNKSKKYQPENIHKGFDLARLLTSAKKNNTTSIIDDEINELVKRLKDGEPFDIVIKDTWYKKYKNPGDLILDTFNCNVNYP